MSKKSKVSISSAVEHLESICLRFENGADPLSEAEAQKQRRDFERSVRYTVDLAGPWRRYSETVPFGYTIFGTICHNHSAPEHRVGVIAVHENRHYVQVNDGLITALSQADVYDALTCCPPGCISREYLERGLLQISRCYGNLATASYWFGRVRGLIRRYCADYFCPINIHRGFLGAETCEDPEHVLFARGYREGVMMVPWIDAFDSSRMKMPMNGLKPCHAHQLVDSVI